MSLLDAEQMVDEGGEQRFSVSEKDRGRRERDTNDILETERRREVLLKRHMRTCLRSAKDEVERMSEQGEIKGEREVGSLPVCCILIVYVPKVHPWQCKGRWREREQSSNLGVQ